MEQQNQNVQVEEGVSLMDIIRLLLSKIKLLILVVLIGAIAGGAFGVWRTVGNNYFGTTVDFYVNPEKPEESTGTTSGTAAGGSQYGVYGAYGKHVMDNMVKLLSSDSFTERLLLNGEALPEKNVWIDEKETVLVKGEEKSLNDELNKAIDEATPFLEAVAACEADYEEALSSKAVAVKAYSDAETTLNTEWRTLFQQGKVKKASFNEEEYFKLENPSASLSEAYGAFVSAQNEVDRKTTDANNKEEAWRNAKKEASGPVEEALELWRSSAKYVSELLRFKESISFSYLESDEDVEEVDDLARSFIYVTISVRNSSHERGMALANDLFERVKTIVPEYVSENMTVPSGYSGTNCQRITRTDNIRLTNPNYTTNQAIKFAILAGVAALIVAAVVIIILDRSDKRLRDAETVTKLFNVPLLGVVPPIEEIKAESTAKKKAEKTTEVK